MHYLTVTRKMHYLTVALDLEVKVTQNVAHYPLLHVAYSCTMFGVATSNGLGDAFTRKYII